MIKFAAFALLALCCTAMPLKKGIPKEDFGYISTAKNAHMFWVMYGAQDTTPENSPTILWLQGGPGGSSTGFGGFGEIGPLDVNLQPREYTWNKKANLLLVDQPVGTGYSYVEAGGEFTKNQAEIDEQLLILIKGVVAKHPELEKTPFYIFCESYGGKMTASFGVHLHKAIQNKEIVMNFKGVALGDSWGSPIACMESYGSFLNAISEVTDAQAAEIDGPAKLARAQIAAGNITQATNLWSQQQGLIMAHTGSVNFYNYLEHGSSSSMDPYPMLRTRAGLKSQGNDIPEAQLDMLMNGQMKKKWNIPESVTWGGQSNDVFENLAGDFMTDVVSSVTELLDAGLKVVVYNGALDVIVDTPCVTAWMKTMKWEKLPQFYAAPRVALYTNSSTQETVGFRQSYDNLQFWTLLKAGHMVPADMPELATQMFEYITEV